MVSDLRIDGLIARLRTAGATGVDEYELKLRLNENCDSVLLDLHFEGRAALMFLAHQWKVHLREIPDLEMRFDGELLYAEVKHFRQKLQDVKDEEAMLAAGPDELVPYGDLGKAEGCQAWEQILDVAIKKAAQCIEGAPNILVIESSSISLELMATSGVHAIDEARQSGFPDLRRFSGIVLVDASDWTRFGEAEVEFCRTSHAAVPLTEKLSRALDAICPPNRSS